jgi:hypothetical protein
MTNQSTDQATENYFIENDFSEESLKYIRSDLFSRRMSFQREYGFYDNQAQMFARLAEQAKSGIESCNTEFKLVEEALHELRIVKKVFANH